MSDLILFGIVFIFALMGVNYKKIEKKVSTYYELKESQIKGK